MKNALQAALMAACSFLIGAEKLASGYAPRAWQSAGTNGSRSRRRWFAYDHAQREPAQPGPAVISRRHQTVAGCVCERSSALPVRKDEMAPATAVEFLPRALRLSEAVGDGVDCRRMMAEAAVAAIDLDVLDLGPVFVQAGLPGADAVGAAEDGGRRHGRCLDQRIKQILVFDLAAARDLIGAPGVGRFGRAGERTAQADQAAHPVGYDLGELAGIEAAQAPADEADPAPAVALEQLVDAAQHVALEVGAQAEGASLVPAMRLVAVRIEKTAQSVGAAVA